MDTQRIAHLIDLEKLPLDRLDSDDYAQVVAAAQAELDVDGCTVIKGFLRSEALPQLSKEITTIRPQLHESLIDINPYFSEGDPSLPHDHPVNTFIERSGGFIPRDAFNPTSDFEAVYQNPAFLSFLSDCLNVPEVHCFADPLAGLTINVLGPGQQFAWHFDTNDFAVTCLIDGAEEGGLFEYSPGIRGDRTENFAGMAEVLADRPAGRASVKTLELHPGDLQIFRGRNSVHRVTRVGVESTTRNTAVFAYTEEAGVIGRLERTYQLFGRVLPAHQEAERQRVRSDDLKD